MANNASAIKRIRQNAKSRTRNRGNASRVRTSLKNIRELIQKGDKAAALKIQPDVQKAIDKAAAQGIYKKNAAARIKSRLMRDLNALS